MFNWARNFKIFMWFGDVKLQNTLISLSTVQHMGEEKAYSVVEKDFKK